MKQFIKILAATLLSGFAFVSCNDDFDDAAGGVNYPDGYELGMWTAQYTPAGSTTYSVSLTVNEEGDTICNLVYVTPAGRVNVMANGKVTYNKKTGVISADYDVTPYDLPGRVTLARRNDLNGYTVGVYTINGDKFSNKGTFVSVAVDTIMVYGEWSLNDGSVMTLNLNGKADIVAADGESESGTYTFSGNSGEVKVGADTYALSLNEKGQMYLSKNGGTAQYISRISTQPEDDWYEMAIGKYISWLWGSKECVLEYSDSRAMARIYGWFGPTSQPCIDFYWTPGESTVSMTENEYDTFYDFSQNGQFYGRIFGSMVPLPEDIDENGNKALYKNNVFYFGMEYVIPAVGVGFTNEEDVYVDMYRIDKDGWLVDTNN